MRRAMTSNVGKAHSTLKMLVHVGVIYILDRCEENLSFANKYNLYEISFCVILHCFVYKMWCRWLAYVIRTLEFRLWHWSFVSYPGRYYRPMESYLAVGSVGKCLKDGSKVDLHFAYEIVLLVRSHCLRYEEFKGSSLVQILTKQDHALPLFLILRSA